MRARTRRLIVEVQGGVSAEYIAVLSLVSLGLAVAAYQLGPPLVHLYEYQRAGIALPIL